MEEFSEQTGCILAYLEKHGPQNLEQICLNTSIDEKWARYVLRLHRDIFRSFRGGYENLVRFWEVTPEEERNEIWKRDYDEYT